MMYAFKVVVTTLIFLMMVMIVFAALNGNRNTKIYSMIYIVIQGLTIIAIWG